MTPSYHLLLPHRATCESDEDALKAWSMVGVNPSSNHFDQHPAVSMDGYAVVSV